MIPPWSRYIYGLCGPDMHIRYIGLTGLDIRSRVNSHLSAAKKGESELHKWLMEVGSDLIAVELECVELDRNGRRSLDREKWWILHAIEKGCKLFNKFIPNEKFKIVSRETASEIVPILKAIRDESSEDALMEAKQ